MKLFNINNLQSYGFDYNAGKLRFLNSFCYKY